MALAAVLNQESTQWARPQSIVSSGDAVNIVFQQTFQSPSLAEPVLVIVNTVVFDWYSQTQEFQRKLKIPTVTEFDFNPLPYVSSDGWISSFPTTLNRIKPIVAVGVQEFYPLPFVPGPEGWSVPYQPALINRLRRVAETGFDFDPLPRPPDVENWAPPLQEPQQRLKQIIRQEFDLDPLPRVAGPESWTGNFPSQISKKFPFPAVGMQILNPLPFVPGPESWTGYQQERVSKIKPLVAEGWFSINLVPQVPGPEGWNPNLSEPVRKKFELVREGEFDFDPSPRPPEVASINVTFPDQFRRLAIPTRTGQQILDPNPISNQVTFWYPEFPSQFFRAHVTQEPFISIDPFPQGNAAPSVAGWMYPVEIPPRSLRPLLHSDFPDHDLSPPPVGTVSIYTLAQTNVGL